MEKILKDFNGGTLKMVWSETDKFAYCSFTCPHQDRYNGWCNYYYKDLGEIDEQKCEHIQEVIKEHKRIIGEE